MGLENKYKALIFDLDGTILDTLDDLADSVCYALKVNGQPQRSTDEVRQFVGNGIRKLIERAVAEGTDAALTQKVYQDFMEYYKVHCADKTRPYEGIVELMSELKVHGYMTAVVSNKADGAVNELCRRYFPQMFDYCVGERDGIAKKPSPDSVNEVIRKLGIGAGEAVYIGDSEVDIETAANAKMDCIIVSWGFRDADYLKSMGAEIIVHNPKEIEDLI
jgi:phosphoglycolate phosphatase